MRRLKTEHSGAKGSTRKSGFYGYRSVAKKVSAKQRRANDRREISEQQRGQ